MSNSYRKLLGQHFLKDKNLINKIISQIKEPQKRMILEIGAGHGELTLPLSSRCKEVIAIEIDRILFQRLREKVKALGIENVEILEGDILRLSLNEITGTSYEDIIIVGNIPYSISSPIIDWMIGERDHIEYAILMFQKEFAKRLCALPGNRQCGVLSVILRYYADVKELFEISKESFFPKPKVDSMLLKIQFKSHPKRLAKDEKIFREVVKASFSNRRKTILNSLSHYFRHIKRDEIKSLLHCSHIDPKRRAESLTLDEFITLSDIFSERYHEKETFLK